MRRLPVVPLRIRYPELKDPYTGNTGGTIALPDRMPGVPPDASCESADLTVRFCGSSCWRRSTVPSVSERQCQRGGETFAELGKEAGQHVDVTTTTLEIILDGCTVTLQKTGGCLGACSKDPAACVVVGDTPSPCFRADSADAVRSAVQQIRHAQATMSSAEKPSCPDNG